MRRELEKSEELSEPSASLTLHEGEREGEFCGNI